jgi:predicted peptidase
MISNSNAQDLNLYEKEIYIHENDTLNYRILKPLNYDSNKQYPVHLFLHGSGERGNNNVSQLVHGGKLFLKKKKIENNIIHGLYFHKLQKAIGGVTVNLTSLIIM